MSNIFKTVLLLALPASGKSEVRNFMANMDPEILKNDFHIGANLQLDDFPYVHFMRRVDEELQKRDVERIFYASPADPFNTSKDWGTLTLLLNEDYETLKNRVPLDTESYAMNLFARIDNAAMKLGINPRIAALDDEVLFDIAEALEDDAREISHFVENQFTDDFDNKTLIIECARGGPDGAEMPLKDGYGYIYTLPLLSDEILNDAAILYIWVTPEESRRKNQERANPDDPGSNLFHGVPIKVMLDEYGCDDMSYLVEQSDVTNTVKVEKKNGSSWNVPIGIFDNRVDKTSFLRADKEDWSESQIKEMTESVKNATDAMWSNYKK